MAPRSDRGLRFVNEFIEHSRQFKQPFLERWREVIDNFMVEPHDFSRATSNPYRNNRASGRRSGVILKDGETHKAIMTYAAKLVTAVIGDERGEYIRAAPVGYEDAPRSAPTVTRLLRYAFALPGHYRTLVEAVLDSLLMGTAIVEIGWNYTERNMLVRQFTNTYGVEEDTSVRSNVVANDDASLTLIDNEDFFPDPTEYRMERMVGAAKRFRMNGMQARAMGETGIYDKAAVDRALNLAGGTGVDRSNEDDFRSDQPDPETQNVNSDFNRSIGYEYWGEVPWGETGSSRRVITTLNNIEVRNREYPLADPDLPFRALTINPVNGRFYGVSPGEVIRYDQDLQDAIKILLAEAIVKQVHPPIIYDSGVELDVDKLRAWKANVPIGIDGGPDKVSTLQYGANVFNGFAFSDGLKRSMQETSGAVGIMQGQGMGTKRASATESSITAQQAMDRPELAASILEREAMPNIARSILRRYQQFLDTEDLANRVGSDPIAPWIGEIQGDFDIRFVGSRMAMTRQQKFQAFSALAQLASAIPELRAQIPWQMLGKSLVGDVLELPEVAAMIADPGVMRDNLMLNQAMGGGQTGNGNGTIGSSTPSLPEAQLAGSESAVA